MGTRTINLIILSLLFTDASATPPPPIPDTSCTATLCFQISPEPVLVSSQHTPHSGHVTTIIQAAPGIVLTIASLPASRLNAATMQKHGAFRWSRRSATKAVASACLNCGESTPWEPQWVGVAVSAQSPEQLEAYLTTAGVLIRAIELNGFYAETSPAFRVSEMNSLFSVNRQFGKWVW